MHFDFLIGWSGAPDIVLSLIRIFKEKGKSAGVITRNSNVEKLLKNSGENVYNCKKAVLETKVNEKDLPCLINKYEEKYNISLNEFCWPEHIYHGEKMKYLIEKAVKHFIVFEGYFDNNNIGCWAESAGAMIAQRVVRAIGEKIGFLSICFFPFPPFSGRMFLRFSPMFSLEDYTFIPCDSVPLEERKKFENLLSTIKENKKIITYEMMDAPVREKSNFGKILTHWTSYRKGNKEPLRIAIRAKIQRRIVEPYRDLVEKLYYSEFNPQEKYLFFPFHHHIDSQITVRNPHFFHQWWLVEMISRALPSEYKLYIKGHPGVSFLHIEIVKKAAGLKNVVILSPNVNPHLVIENAAAVIIINSTVGFEAWLYNKPVIVLGNWMMRGLGISLDVDDLRNLSSAVRQALAMKLNENQVKSVLYSLYESMHKGSFWVQNPDYAAIASSLIKKQGSFGTK